MKSENPENNSVENPSLRILEWVLVIFIAFVPSIVGSIYAFAYGSKGSNKDIGNEIIFGGIIYELIAIIALWFILASQKRNIKEILPGFKIADIPISIILMVINYFIYIAGIFIFHKIFFILNGQQFISPEFNNAYMQSGLSIFSLLLVAINPFYEELIVRAYTITELSTLANSKFIGIAVSVIIQSLYHLYQGGAATFALALTFIIYSVYYAQTKRIWPIILTHLYFDLIALIHFSIF
jgi:membrane protease YdiL (CAAX protease family)